MFFSLLVFNNSLFYTFFLLTLVASLTSFLYSFSLISALSRLILVLVYVGAMIILVAYICAVSPNLITNSYVRGYAVIFTLVLIFLYLDSVSFAPATSQTDPLREFYSSELCLFSLIVGILFVTLLIVTSQQTSPRGPFRSL